MVNDNENNHDAIGNSRIVYHHGSHDEASSSFVAAAADSVSPFDGARCFGRAVFLWLSPYVNEVASSSGWDTRKHSGATTPPLPTRMVPQHVLLRFEEELRRIHSNNGSNQKRDNDRRTNSSMFYEDNNNNNGGRRLLTTALFRVYRKDILMMLLLLTMAGVCWILIPSFWIRNLVIFSETPTTTTITATPMTTTADQGRSSSPYYSDEASISLLFSEGTTTSVIPTTTTTTTQRDPYQSLLPLPDNDEAASSTGLLFPNATVEIPATTATTTNQDRNRSSSSLSSSLPSSSSSDESSSSLRLTGFLYAIGLIVTELMRSLCIQNFWFRSSTLGCEMKTLVYSLTFSRSIALRRTQKDFSVSELVNLCSNDGERIFECARMIPTLFLGVFLLSTITVVGYIILGPAILAGVFVVLVLVPMQVLFANIIGKMRKKGVKYTNERVGIMTELLTNIKLVKMYNWELAFNDKVAALRHKEQAHLVPASQFNSVLQSFTYVVPTLSSVVTFLVHIGTGNTVNAQDAFAIVGLFNVLVMPLSVFPVAVRSLAEGRIGWKHLGELLVAKNYFSLPPPPSDEALVIEIKNGAFDWDEDKEEEPEDYDHNNNNDDEPGVISVLSISLGDGENEEEEVDTYSSAAMMPPRQEHTTMDAQPSLALATTYSLTNVNVRIYPKELIGVCGAVGSGKSTFCSALIGGIKCIKGRLGIQGTVGYVSQLAWILPNTVKENILFGNAHDPIRYERTIDACCLKSDLEILPSGDETMIGERGVNLSGGQKQRIALARAVYSNRDVYILDDPLSAVDPHVGRRIFNECLLSVLKNKTVVFVTHQLQYLPECDRVIFIKNGRTHMGHYQELISKSKAFDSFLTSLKEDNTKQQLQQQQQQQSSPNESNNKSHQNEIKMPTRSDSDVTTDNATRVTTPSENKNNYSNGSHNHGLDSNRNASKVTGPSGDGPTDDPNDNPGSDEKSEEKSSDDSKQQFSWATVRAFGQAGDGYLVFIFVLLLYVFAVGAKIFSDRWLAFWISRGDGVDPNGDMGDNPNLWMYLVVYASSAVGVIVLQAVRAAFYNLYMLRASTSLHNRLVRTLMHAPLWFFDTKPIGQILARVSKDLDEIDVRIPVLLEQFLTFSSFIILTLGLISFIFPYFAIGLPFIGVVYVLVVRRFSPAQVYSKQIETKSSGPVISHMVASLDGISIIQAFQAQDATLTEFWKRFNEQASGLFYFFGVQSWAAYRLDFVSLSIVSITALLIPAMHGTAGLEPGLTGLGLVYANSLAGLWQATTRLGTEAAARLTSVQRVMDYINNISSEKLSEQQGTTNKPQNPQGRTKKTLGPSSSGDDCGGSTSGGHGPSLRDDWPATGRIEFDLTSASYRPELPAVLSDIRISISDGEKIGVVGRTGSGKSTLSMCLFRLIAELKGDIYIDGVSTAAVSLDRLRSSLGIIPQDPVMFQGTVRYNLDPFGWHDDDVLWNALRRAHIQEMIACLPFRLDTVVLAGGANFSVGERQLLCMARALLRDCKIMILDEATSAIDTRTDEIIQETIRTEFSMYTVLTIAHRIETIIDADRILVLDRGRVVEYDSPQTLMERPRSSFRGFVHA